MTTPETLDQHEALHAHTDGDLFEALHHIIDVCEEATAFKPTLLRKVHRARKLVKDAEAQTKAAGEVLQPLAPDADDSEDVPVSSPAPTV